MELIYNQNFWTFYTLNQKEVDNIIYAQFHSLHVDQVSAKEMFSEILIRLENSKTLDGFDPKLGKLNTYLTWTVRGYIRQVLTAENKTPFSISQENEDGNIVVIKGTRVLAWGLNNLPEDEDSGSDTLYVSGADFGCELESNEILEKIKAGLTEREWRIVDLLMLGLNDKQVGDCLGVTGRFIGMIRSKRLREKVQRILTRIDEWVEA